MTDRILSHSGAVLGGRFPQWTSQTPPGCLSAAGGQRRAAGNAIWVDVLSVKTKRLCFGLVGWSTLRDAASIP